MRKALIPMLASLILCLAATAALIANARAQGTRKPVVALVGGSALLAQNDALPTAQGMPPATMGRAMRDFCQDRYARQVGRMAYLEARLELTQAQRPLFEHWKQVMLDIAGRRASDCSQRVGLNGRHADPVARMSREEDRLKKRIADLDTERPVFASFYQGLTPEQREILSPSQSRRGRGFARARPNFGPPPPSPRP